MTPPDRPYHVPVLAREVVDLLVTDPNGRYVDGTLGGEGTPAGSWSGWGLQGPCLGSTGIPTLWPLPPTWPGTPAYGFGRGTSGTWPSS